jgi:cell division septation protein DedD
VELRRRVGISLLDLFLAALIVVILSAILIPVFARAREQARQVTDAANPKPSLAETRREVREECIYDALW